MWKEYPSRGWQRNSHTINLSPLSDQEIAQALHGQGLTIARRTVAKYREELGVLPSHQRRLLAKKK